MSIYEAKTQLSSLVDKVLAGDQVIITRRGKPVVELKPIASDKGVVFGVRKDTWPRWNPESQDEELRKMFDPELL